MNRSLHDRARRINERALIRAWEYRQRNYSKGVWFRLKRLLADAAQMWVVEESDADALEVKGHAPHPVGSEIVPPKRIYVVESKDREGFRSSHEIPVRLSAEFLAARCLILAKHDGGRSFFERASLSVERGQPKRPTD